MLNISIDIVMLVCIVSIVKQETKILPVALTSEQRNRLRTLAYEGCVAMSELVRWWIDEKWAGRAKPETSPKPEVKPVNKPTFRASSMERSIYTCEICKKPIESDKWVLNKEGKRICQPCAHKVAGV